MTKLNWINSDFKNTPYLIKMRAQKNKNRKNANSGFELRRQLFHLLIGLAAVVLLYYNILNALIIFIILVAGIILSLLCKKFKIPVVYWLLSQFEREDEFRKFPGKGAMFFCAGVLLTVKLFPKDIALASIIILALGDSISHLVGMYFGKTKGIFGNKSKYLEGTVAGIIAAFIGALLFVVWYEALLAAVVAMIAEAVELDMNKHPVDDNLIVPLAAGTSIYVLRMVI